LLGTLWGLFETLVVINANAQARFVQSIDLTQGVARAISSAACGLGAAIICHIYYNALIVRVDRLILDMERTASEMFVYFSKNKGGV
jgi:biopolymer transport protein ExbB/TolQ